MWPSTPDRDPGLMWPPQPVGAGQPMGLLARQQPRGGLLGAGMAPGGGGGLLRPGRPVLGALGNNANALLMMGMGMLSGQGNKDAWGRGAAGFQAGSGMDMSRRDEKRLEEKLKKEAEQEAKRQAALAKLSGGGFPEWDALPDAMKEFALADDTFLRTVMSDIAGNRINPDDPAERWNDESLNGMAGQRNANTREFDPFPVVAGDKPTSDIQEYQFAVEQGFQGTFTDYQTEMKRAGAQNVNVNTGVRIPANFMPDPDDPTGVAVVPIPGGPGEQMPAELAARIGLARDAIPKLREVEEAAAKGDLTGPLDWGLGQIGRGQQGSMRRELQAGAEALTRMLTGAGMNLAEVKREVSLYLPAIQDDAPTLVDKVQQLRRRLEGTVDEALRGRGGARRAEPAAPEAEGWQDRGNGVRIRRID